MNSSPLVSICLPIFNGSKHIAAAINSVLAQTYGEFELLISDDGSTDGSEAIVSQYAKANPRIRYWKNESRQGLFGNYNACIKESRGKYLKPFAQDDLLAPQCLEKMVRLLEAEPEVALVCSSRKIIDDAGKELSLKQPFPKDMRMGGKDVRRFNLIGLNNWIGEPSTVMFRKERAGTGFDTTYYHYGDIEYWLRVLSFSDCYYFHQPLASFRRHEQSQTDVNHRELLFALDILRMSSLYRSDLAEFEPEELFKRRLAEKIALEHGHTVSELGSTALLKQYTDAFLTSQKTPKGWLMDEAKAFNFPVANLKDKRNIARTTSAYNKSPFAESSGSQSLASDSENSSPSASTSVSAGSSEPAESEAEIDKIKAQAAGFRLLSSMALSTISQLIEELDHEKRCRHDEHERFVAEVEKMQNSVYWKLTDPLRKIKKAIKPQSD